MESPITRVDFGADAPSPAEIERWSARARELVTDPPPWLRLGEAEVPDSLLALIPVQPALVLGIGGSALGARAALTIARRDVISEVRILDALDPEVVRESFDWAVGVGAQLITVSKSGGTVEILELLSAARARGLGPGVLVSDPLPKNGDVSPLRRALADATLVLDMPSDVGGRYSVLTAVGQAPLRAAGLDPKAMLRGARRAVDHLRDGCRGLAARVAHRLAHAAPCSVLWCYAESLVAWGHWVQQLECESLGRVRPDGSRTGETVVVLRGPADQHSVAQLLLEGPRNARVTVVDYDQVDDAGGLAGVRRLGAIERDATFEAMTLPSSRMLVRDRTLETLGGVFVEGMAETVLVAEAWAISPYGQPAVEQIKRRIRAKLSR